eukprot:m.380165 g.380165  ORF g.380165 m.380165 type:complete len:348 (+) comp20034_c0_seq7:267-1310(+)
MAMHLPVEAVLAKRHAILLGKQTHRAIKMAAAGKIQQRTGPLVGWHHNQIQPPVKTARTKAADAHVLVLGRGILALPFKPSRHGKVVAQKAIVCQGLDQSLHQTLVRDTVAMRDQNVHVATGGFPATERPTRLELNARCQKLSLVSHHGHHLFNFRTWNALLKLIKELQSNALACGEPSCMHFQIIQCSQSSGNKFFGRCCPDAPHARKQLLGFLFGSPQFVDATQMARPQNFFNLLEGFGTCLPQFPFDIINASHFLGQALELPHDALEANNAKMVFLVGFVVQLQKPLELVGNVGVQVGSRQRVGARAHPSITCPLRDRGQSRWQRSQNQWNNWQRIRKTHPKHV